MWASVQSSITSAFDNPLAAGSSALDSAIGPSFDYLQKVQSPGDLNVGSDPTLDQVFRNADAIGTYVGDLLDGPGGESTGNQFFKDSGGMCRLPGTRDKDGNDTGDGPVVPRSTYTNNKLGMSDAAGIFGSSFQKAVAGGGMNGLIPAMGGDIASMNPLKIMNGLVLDGVPPCQAYTCPVTDIQTGVNQGNETRFLTPQLEFNLSPCSPATPDAGAQLLAQFQAEQAAAKAAAEEGAEEEEVSESFANFQENLYQPPAIVEYIDPMSYITLGAAVFIFIGYVLTK